MSTSPEIKCLKTINNTLIAADIEGNIKIYTLSDSTPEIASTKNLELGQINGLNLESKTAFLKNGVLIKFDDLTNLNPVFTELAHEGFITSVTYNEIDNTICSSSWDQTIKYFSLDNEKLENVNTFKLETYIWQLKTLTVKFNNKTLNINVGCSKDGEIFFFNKNKILHKYKIHKNCIRNIFLPDLEIEVKKEFDEKTDMVEILTRVKIISVSNNGIMLVHNEHRIFKILKLDSYCYKIKKLNEKFYVCCNNYKILEIDENFVITRLFDTNTETNWDLTFLGEKVFVYDSQTGSVVEINNATSTNSSNKPVKHFENDKFLIKDGKVYGKQDGKLELLGDHVEKSLENKLFYIRKEVPEKFKFPIESAGKTLMIEFCETENLEQVAENFVVRNDLDKSHKPDIVNFIKQNFTVIDSKTVRFKGVDLFSDLSTEKIVEKLRKYKNTEFLIEFLKRAACIKPNVFKSDEFEDINKMCDSQIVEETINTLRSLFNEVGVDDRFVILDVVRYLVLFEGLSFDFVYYLNFYWESKEISNKEKIVLLRILCNFAGLNCVEVDRFSKLVNKVNFKAEDYEKYLKLTKTDKN